jgi:hypothetical protein
LPGANRAVVPNPSAAANRCNLRHVTPKTLQKALYVGLSQIGRPLQVVCFGGSRFPILEAHLYANLARHRRNPRPIRPASHPHVLFSGTDPNGP